RTPSGSAEEMTHTMTKHESLRASGEALSAVGRSRAPVSRHDAAMQRYLRTMDHTSLSGSQPTRAAEPPATSTAGKGPHPLFTEIHATTPSPLEGAPISGEEPDTGLGRSDVVVVGIDGSPYARKASLWAAVEADRRHARLVLVHAYSLPVAGYAGYSMAPDDLGTVMRVE